MDDYNGEGMDENMDFWQWKDETEGEKLTREAQEAEDRKKQEYIRFNTLFDYFKTIKGVSREYIFYNADNVNKLDKMNRIFLESEEYEKCALIRDWKIEIDQRIKEKKKATKKEKTLQDNLTF